LFIGKRGYLKEGEAKGKGGSEQGGSEKSGPSNGLCVYLAWNARRQRLGNGQRKNLNKKNQGDPRRGGGLSLYHKRERGQGSAPEKKEFEAEKLGKRFERQAIAKKKARFDA